jgi:hypothetical protein
MRRRNVFTTISYDKGGSIIRMMEHLFLGHDNFHRAYIVRNLMATFMKQACSLVAIMAISILIGQYLLSCNNHNMLVFNRPFQTYVSENQYKTATYKTLVGAWEAVSII